MTLPDAHNDREQSWRDQLPPEELAITDRLRGMSSQMQSAWLGVEIYRVRRQLEKTEAGFALILEKSNAATAKAITDALRAANPTPVNGGNWTISAAQRAWFVVAGGGLTAGAAGALRALGVI